MRTRNRLSIVGAIAVLALSAAPSAGAQVERTEDKTSPSVAASVPIERLVAAVAKRTGRRFMIDPRVRADVTLIGQEPTSIDYPTLLWVLRLHGFAAVEQGGYVQVIPDANIRQQSLPTASGKESYPEGEYVNRIIMLKNVPAAHLVPILRPLLPQVAHLVAMPCKNALLVTDVFASVKRIEQLARALDVGDAYAPPSCSQDWPPKQGS